ncbi:MAG: ester cyclase [Bacteroidota bacterium]
MKKSQLLFAALSIFVAIMVFSSCNSNNTTANQSEIDSLRSQLTQITAGNELVAKNIKAFDTLDFNVFSRRDWKRFHESHAQDVVVHFPDGHQTNGLKKHIDDMEAMFVYAPDTRITAHLIKIGSGNITAVTGIMEGTFTEPMPDGKGGFIKPTGKKFKIPMSTFSIWKADGTMSEEFLYWDNLTYMKQLGLM